MTPEEAQKLLDRLNDQEKQNLKHERAKPAAGRARPGEGLVIRFLAAVGLLLAAPVAAADDVRVSVSVLPSGRVTDTTQVRLVIRVDGESIPDVGTPKLPVMQNLRVTGGPASARNSSYSFDNGRISSSNALTLTYFLLPLGPGQAEIPSFDVIVGGTTYRTQPLRFTVEAGRSGPAPPSPGSRAAGRGRRRRRRGDRRLPRRLLAGQARRGLRLQRTAGSPRRHPLCGRAGERIQLDRRSGDDGTCGPRISRWIPAAIERTSSSTGGTTTPIPSRGSSSFPPGREPSPSSRSPLRCRSGARRAIPSARSFRSVGT